MLKNVCLTSNPQQLKSLLLYDMGIVVLLRLHKTRLHVLPIPFNFTV